MTLPWRSQERRSRSQRVATTPEPGPWRSQERRSRSLGVATNPEPVRTDNRLSDMPMVPVACRDCGAAVLARKSSWNQTSVQWNAEASALCTERQDAERIAGHRRQPFLVCSALRESIEEAIATGELAIVDGP